MSESQQLLAEYAQRGSEPAFRDLVARYINLVYGTAVRLLGGDKHLAEDVAQTVFIHLARDARRLDGQVMLGGWLHRDTCNVASKLLRGERRRLNRERQAAQMNTLLNHPEPAPNQITSLLDGALDRLEDEDRTAILLRFFEEKDFRSVGEALGISEEAARKRVSRALEKLQGGLRRRGVNATVPTLSAALVACAALTAPTSLAATVATGALAAGAAGGSLSIIATKLLTAAKTKTAAAGLLALGVAGVLIFHYVGANPHQTPTVTGTPAAAPSAAQSSASQADSALVTTSATNAVSSTQMAFQLLEAETGDPLPGAKLHLFYLLDDGRGKAVKAMTDANGRLAVDKPQAPYRALNFFVAAAGHVPKVTSWGFRTPMPSQYTMKLERGLTIAGLVVDESGQPIPGAKIEFDGPGNEMSQAENIQFGPDTPVTTDANGQWWCSIIPKQLDTVSLIATHPEHAETHLVVHPSAPGATKVSITMPAGFTVAGLVQDANGSPIEGASIRQVRFNGENERSQPTDVSGAFQFKHTATGELLLAVQAKGFAPGVQTLQVTGNVPTLRFQLGPGQLLRGRIVDEQGNPVANAFIETTRRAVDKIKWCTNTDASGRFEWDSAPPEPLLYSVLAEGFNRAYAQSLKADGSEHDIKLTRHSPEKDNVQITGTVADEDTGTPLDEFKVFISELDPEWAFPLEFYTTGDAGVFEISIPSKSSHPGYRVQVEKEGYLPAASRKFLRKDGNQTVEFKLRKGSGPSGVVLLPNGKPAADATVLLCTSLAGVTLDGAAHVQPGLNTSTYRTQTDARGHFSLAPAVDPQGLIVIHDEGFAQVAASEVSTGLNLTLQPWGRLEGKLVLDSRPAANEQIIAANQVARYTEDGRRFGFLSFRLETTTGADGKFAFDKVPPGQCSIFRFKRVSNAMFSSNEQLITCDPGEVTQVVLGGSGRPIIGKAVCAAASSPSDWSRVVVQVSSGSSSQPGARPKREDFHSVQAFIDASERFFNQRQPQQHFAALCGADGSFRIPDVPAGRYELAITIRDFKANSAEPHDISDPAPVIASLTRQITVPEDQSEEPVDLGTLEMTPQQSTASAK